MTNLPKKKLNEWCQLHNKPFTETWDDIFMCEDCFEKQACLKKRIDFVKNDPSFKGKLSANRAEPSINLPGFSCNPFSEHSQFNKKQKDPIFEKLKFLSEMHRSMIDLVEDINTLHGEIFDLVMDMEVEK